MSKEGNTCSEYEWLEKCVVDGCLCVEIDIKLKGLFRFQCEKVINMRGHHLLELPITRHLPARHLPTYHRSPPLVEGSILA